MAKSRMVSGPPLADQKGVDRALNQNSSTRIVVALAVTAAVGVVALADARLSAEEDGSAQGLIQRVIAQTNRSGLAVCATRELRAGTVSGKHQGWMLVETTLTPAGAFAWKVIEEGGSGRTREKVFEELLKSEADSWRAGVRDRAALTLDNYQFTRLPGERAGLVQIRLTPRRADAALIDGTLTVSADGYPVRVEGKLAKSPSFWVKSVSVVKHYSRFAGVALPTSIESLADLKMFGRATLTMRYRYSAVNGRTVLHAVASAPFVGPSAEILALHGSVSQQ